MRKSPGHPFSEKQTGEKDRPKRTDAIAFREEGLEEIESHQSGQTSPVVSKGLGVAQMARDV